METEKDQNGGKKSIERGPFIIDDKSTTAKGSERTTNE
jgi:hypothetical protein